jgi:hypothetical protein
MQANWWNFSSRMVAHENALKRSDATIGRVINSPLANATVWAGFPSVNQTNPNLIAFAGQFNEESNYYNKDLNYVWVTERSTVPPTVAPLDREAPSGVAFLAKIPGTCRMVVHRWQLVCL